MKTVNTQIKRTLGAVAAVIMLILVIGCSGDNNPIDSGGGNNTSPPPPEPVVSQDRITVSLSRLDVAWDCEGVNTDNPGDFYYRMNVDTLGDDNRWYAITGYGESSANLNSGEAVVIGNRSASFTMPREEGSQFRVRLTLRESDGAGDNDFSRSQTYVHRYNVSTEKWDPRTTGYSYNANSRNGTMNWNVHIRDRKKILFVVTEEGCSSTLQYKVSSRVED